MNYMISTRMFHFNINVSRTYSFKNFIPLFHFLEKKFYIFIRINIYINKCKTKKNNEEIQVWVTIAFHNKHSYGFMKEITYWRIVFYWVNSELNRNYCLLCTASFLVASCNNWVSTSSAGSCTYRTTEPRIKQFFTES